METGYLIGLAVVWVLIGLTLAVMMRRQGHDLGVWLALGIVLGPLTAPLAIEHLRDRPSHPVSGTEPGDCDVLAGVDGSHESVTAIHDALEILGERLTSLTVATVLDHDQRHVSDEPESRAAAETLLAGIVEGLGRDDVRTEVLYGRPDEALAKYATAAGMELIVVGARGRGASKALLGSTSGRMVGRSPVPVMVGRQRIR